MVARIPRCPLAMAVLVLSTTLVTLANGQSPASDVVATVVALVGAVVAASFAGYGTNLLRKSRRSQDEIHDKLLAAATWDGIAATDSDAASLTVGPPPSHEGGWEDKQFALLKQYHDQGLAQSRVSFWFSLIAASVGFMVIVTAFLIADSGVAITQQGRAALTLLAGTIVETTAGLFFVQSNRARKLMIEFFDRLRMDRKLFEALKLAGGCL